MAHSISDEWSDEMTAEYRRDQRAREGGDASGATTSGSSSLSKNWGDLDVFAALRKPAPRARQVLLPPPHVERRPRPASDGIPSAPPLPSFDLPAERTSKSAQRSFSPAHTSDTPPAMARTIPPPAPRPRPLSSSVGLSSLAAWPLSRTSKSVLATAATVMVIALALLRSRDGKIVTVAAGHSGQLLSEAQVIIDGVRSCSGARCTFDAPPGVHEVTVRADGYLPQLQLIAVASGEAAAANFRLEPGGSSLEISGHPEGASLVVDGRWMGRLPLHVDLPPGLHRVRVDADRHLPEERTVELKPGEARTIADIALLPRMARLTMDVRTPDADITLVSGSERIDHIASGQTIDLDLSRQWTLVATKDGFQTLRAPLVWNGDSEKTFVVALDRAVAVAAHR